MTDRNFGHWPDELNDPDRKRRFSYYELERFLMDWSYNFDKRPIQTTLLICSGVTTGGLRALGTLSLADAALVSTRSNPLEVTAYLMLGVGMLASSLLTGKATKEFHRVSKGS